MKIYIHKILTVCLISLALFACEKDEDMLTASIETSPTLTASASTLKLLADSADKSALTFTWTDTELSWSDTAYSHNDAVGYVLKIDKEGNNFAAPQSVEVSNTEKTFTDGELNDLVTRLGLEAFVEGGIEVRLASSLGDNVEPVYSDPVTINVTPYKIDTGYLYVPGNYQGWNPATAPAIAADDNVNYEGYVYFPEATSFKFTSEQDWEHTNYGNAGNGALSIDPSAGDLSVEQGGYFRLIANVEDLTWSATLTNWGVIGDATPDGWDADQDMVYDIEEKVWKITVELIAGKIKFRANDAWDLNLGDTDADGSLEYGGTDIAVTPGNYEIILDLSNAPAYTYSVNKL